MYTPHYEDPTRKEAHRLAAISRGTGLWAKVTSGAKSNLPGDLPVTVFEVRVERCFTPKIFNEELPLYILDIGNGSIMLLFGQWVFDPHTLIAADDLTDNWDATTSFFKEFIIRAHMESGTVLELSPTSPAVINAEVIEQPLRFQSLKEIQILKGFSTTILQDLAQSEIWGR